MGYNSNKPIRNTIKEEAPSEKVSATKDTGKAPKKSKPKTSKTATRKKAKDPRIGISIGVFLMLLSLFILLSYFSYVIGYNLTGDFGDKIGMWLLHKHPLPYQNRHLW